MATVIRIILRVDGARTHVDGQYLVEAKAKRFERFEDAVNAYRAVCPNHRYDSPGHILAAISKRRSSPHDGLTRPTGTRPPSPPYHARYVRQHGGAASLCHRLFG